MQPRKEIPLEQFSTLIETSGVFEKFMDYIVTLQKKLDCLKYFYSESGIEDQGNEKHVEINNRLFSETFYIKIRDKNVFVDNEGNEVFENEKGENIFENEQEMYDFFDNLANSLHIRELTEKKENFEICEKVFSSTIGSSAFQMKVFEKIVYDILLVDMLTCNESISTDAWKTMWSEFKDKLIIPKENQIKKKRFKTPETECEDLDRECLNDLYKQVEVRKRKEFIFNAAAFFIASAVNNAILKKEKGFLVELITIKHDPNFSIEQNIYKEAIKWPETKGIAKYLFKDKPPVFYYYGIPSMGLCPQNKLKEQDVLNMCSNNYVRAEKSLFYQEKKYKLPKSWQDLNKFNNKFPPKKVIAKLTHTELQFLFNEIGLAQDAIVEEITAFESAKLLDIFKAEDTPVSGKEHALFINADINAFIYDKFTQSRFYFDKMDPPKLYLSGFILTPKALYYYYRWENKIKLITQDPTKIERLLSSLENADVLNLRQINQINAIVGFLPEPFAVSLPEEKPKHKHLPQTFLGRLTSSSSPRSPSPSLSPSTSPHIKLSPKEAAPALNDKPKKTASFDNTPRKKSIESKRSVHSFHKVEQTVKKERESKEFIPEIFIEKQKDAPPETAGFSLNK